MATVLFFVALAVFVFGTFATIAFCEAAFAGGAQRRGKLAPHELPVLTGDALRQWAYDRARRIVTTLSQRRGQALTPLAREVEEFTKRVITTITGQSTDSGRCNRRAYRSIPLTAPETLAIVETLRKQSTKRELLQLQRTAARNVDLIQAKRSGKEATENVVCPLLQSNGVCATHDVRPLFCLTHCGGTAADCGSAATAEAEPSFTAVFGEGIAQGLVAGLKDAGENYQIYELNSALAESLDPSATAPHSLVNC